MQIRVIRATSNLVAFLAVFLIVAVNVSHAQDSFRIERPTRPQTQPAQVAAPALNSDTAAASAPSASVPSSSVSPAGSPECQSLCCSPGREQDAGLTSTLPPEGLYTRWRAEFINPTVCPVRLCHGSCKHSSVSCKTVKTRIDSLLDAYIPEEVPVEALLNFRCCAGFTDD